uniref:Uncharacterized protein n=1 Tax=Panstrongylus lignarius TaxID=156445 RepID=A0A224XU49_9HEMI
MEGFLPLNCPLPLPRPLGTALLSLSLLWWLPALCIETIGVSQLVLLFDSTSSLRLVKFVTDGGFSTPFCSE